MKKIINKLFIIIAFTFFLSVSSANSEQNCAQIPQNKISQCEKCAIEDDEYCVYNQCYFDKQYRLLKTVICPNDVQEVNLDKIYNNFKEDLEIQCERYSKEKNKLLELIALDDKHLKEQKDLINYIKTDIKEKYKAYLSDTNEILCKNQRKDFRKFKRKQNKKLKLIKKYGAIYKFPCS